MYVKEAPSDDRRYGVLHGSILGPKLFKVHNLTVGDITRHHDLQDQIYADNNDLYIAFKPSSPEDILTV